MLQNVQGRLKYHNRGIILPGEIIYSDNALSETLIHLAEAYDKL